MNYSIKVIMLIMSMSCADISLGYNPAAVKKLKKAALKSDSKIIPNFAGQDFRGVILPKNLDLHGFFMPGVAFSPCVSNNKNKAIPSVCIDHRGSDLTGVNLASANISNASFDGVILVNADLTGADFTQSSAIGANLTGAKVTGLQAQDAAFCNAIMPDGQICDSKLAIWSGQGVGILCNCSNLPPS